MKKLLVLAAMLAIVATPVLAETASKDGTPQAPQAPTVPNDRSDVRALYEYSTCGTIDCVPDLGGSATGWSEWAIAFAGNDTGVDLCFVEISWPCAGPPSGPYGWIIWTGTGGDLPGPAETAEYYGPYTPVDPDPNTFPPTVYTYVDISAENVPFAAGDIVCYGMDNTGMMGMVSYNGIDTWGWYLGAWDYDGAYGRTAVLQIKADPCGGTPVEEVSWGKVKSLYQ